MIKSSLYKIKLALVCCLLLSSKLLFAQGVDFEHSSWQEIVDLAQKQDKLIYVDFYTTWCGPCKMMDRITFSEEKVGLYSNKYFVAAKFDAEKGEGKLLAQKFKIRGYPTIAFFKPDGKLIKKEVGFRPPEVFIEVLEEYAGNKPMPEPIKEDYFKLKAITMAGLYGKAITKPELISAIQTTKKMGKDKKEFDFLDLKNKLESKLDFAELKLLEATYYMEAGDSRKFEKTINEIFEKDAANADQLHLFAYWMMEKQKVSINTLKWINESIRKNSNFQALDTKAAIQYLYQDIPAASETVDKALKTAKKEGVSPKTSEVLKQMINLKVK